MWIFLLFLAWCIPVVHGHAYMYYPTSRQYLKDQRHMHSNGAEKQGIRGYKSQFGSGPDLRSGPIPDDRFAWDICGTNIEGQSWGLIDDPGDPIVTYKQGGNITFIIVVNGEHGGLYDFRLCPKKIDKSMNPREAAECLDTYLIGRTCVTSDTCITKECKDGCGCLDDKCRDYNLHRDKNDSIYTQNGVYREPYHLMHGAHVFTYKLPKDLHCDHCTIQWYWPTAYNENFRSCADIKIEKSDTPTKPDGRRRRRMATTTPAPVNRRRSSRRRRTSRRRRRSDRRRCKADGANTKSMESEYTVDMEYEEVGCFPLSEGDAAAKQLLCDCDTGNGTRTTDTLRDLTCANHDAYQGSPCRSGLPFYRLHVDRSIAEGLCFRFCASKGLDLFGLVGEVECRCGATYANSKFWGYALEPPKELILDTSSKLPTCNEDSVKVYRYIGWMRYHGADGVQQAMMDLGPTDKKYISSIIKGKL